MIKKYIACLLCSLCTYGFAADFKALESQSGVTIGLSAWDTSNDTAVEYRSDERFPTGSTYKFLVATAVLKKGMTEPQFLNEKIEIRQEDIASWAPVTEKNVGKSISIINLASAAIRYSDNTAAILLTEKLGGRTVLTEFARSIGDKEFTDVEQYSTTPLAMRESLQRVLFGDVLKTAQRDQLEDWMINNTTGNHRIRAGVPNSWKVADKTGSGDYGLANDIAVVWPTGCKPIIMSIYTIQANKKDAMAKNEVVAQSAKMVIEEFAKTNVCLAKQLK